MSYAPEFIPIGRLAAKSSVGGMVVEPLRDRGAHALRSPFRHKARVTHDRLEAPAVLAPEVLKPIRRQLGVAHRVLNVLMPKPGL
jgi:hypothetical protein